MTTTFRNATGTVAVELVTENCCNCGVPFAMAVEFKQQRVRDHDWFFCPSGHSQHYTENETEKKLRQAEKELEAQRGWSHRLEKDLASERKQHAAIKGQLTRTRNRIQAGVCPDCNRHFASLERHMATKHGAEV